MSLLGKIPDPIASNIGFRRALWAAEQDLVAHLPVEFGTGMLCRTERDLAEYWVTRRPFTQRGVDEANQVLNEISRARQSASKSKSKPRKHPRAAWARDVVSIRNGWERERMIARTREARRLALRRG